MSSPLFGLVLAGGYSHRMGKDKGSLIYEGEDQRTRCYKLLSSFCESTYISCRKEQAHIINPPHNRIYDIYSNMGPAGGILSAFRFAPDKAWLVLACDLPLMTEHSVRHLITNRKATQPASVYVDPQDRKLQPLFAIWEPMGLKVLSREVEAGHLSPLKVLEKINCFRIFPPQPEVLTNVNTPEEFASCLSIHLP